MKTKSTCTGCGGTRFSKVSDGSLVCALCQQVLKRKNQFGTEFNTSMNMKNLVRFSTIKESRKGEDSAKNKANGSLEKRTGTPEDSWTELLYLFQVLLTMNIFSVSEHLKKRNHFFNVSEEVLGKFQEKAKAAWFRYLETWQKSGRPLVSCFTFLTGGKYNGAFNLVTKFKATLHQVSFFFFLSFSE